MDVQATQETGTPKVVNKMALTGFILGCASIIFSWIGLVPILAIVFSAIGWGTFDPRKHKSKWMAYAGLGLGILYFFVSLHQYHHI